MSISAQEIDLRCLSLIQAVKSRGVVPQAELDDAIPADQEDAEAWLSFYGQLRVWNAMPETRAIESDAADALVTAAIREAPIPVPEIDGCYVYPKSFETLLQIRVLDTQLDRLTARLISMLGEGASLEQIDGGVAVSACVAYVVHLLLWSWTSKGTGLPFDATNPEPTVPEHIKTLTSSQALAITFAAHQFSASIAACQQLVDPTPAREGGRRPSWAAFFESVGAELHMDAGELAVTSSLAKVLALAFLAGDRRNARPVAPDL